MTKVVILRPQPSADVTLARAAAIGLDAVAIPLFDVRPLAWTAPDEAEYDAILLTSANAVRHGGAELEKLTGLPAICVGEATAAAARSKGFEVAATGTSDGAAAVLQVPAGTRLLHLAGRNHRSVAGSAIPVYSSDPIDPPPPLTALIGGVALVHSPRAGARLAELAAQRDEIMVAAISPAAAEACGPGWRDVRVAAVPTNDALLAVAAELCQD